MSDLLDKKLPQMSVKTLISILAFASTIIGGWYGFQYKLDEAKKLPKPGTGQYAIDLNDANAAQTWPASRTEFDYKYGQLVNRVAILEEEIETLKQKLGN